jgi:hypothetical protein
MNMHIHSKTSINFYAVICLFVPPEFKLLLT